MSGGFLLKLAAWCVALALVALPVVGVLNGWFAADRWPVTRLALRAEFAHVSAEQIRAAAAPALGRGFFALRLDEVRDAVGQLPWVERVEARKRWPDTVELVVYEQRPYAHWSGDRLINREGRLFRVPGGEALQGLPRLAGPDDRLGDVLRFHAGCQREFSGSGLVVDAVTLSPRGGWRLAMTSGTVIEVGRDDAMARLRRFLDVWPRLAPSQPLPPAYVDLRYGNGFALRWAAAGPPPGGDPGLEIRDSQEPAAHPHAAAPAGLARVGSRRRDAGAFAALLGSRLPTPDSRPLDSRLLADSRTPTPDSRLP